MIIPRAVFVVSLIGSGGCAALFPAPLPDLPVADSYRPQIRHQYLLPTVRQRSEALALKAWVASANSLQMAGQFWVRSAQALLAGAPAVGTDGGWGWSKGVWPELMEMAASGSSMAGERISSGSGSCVHSVKRNINNRLTVKADLHVHSAYSHDSAATLRQIFLQAARRGIRVLSITDHDWFTAVRAQYVYEKMRARGELCGPILLIPGMEISSRDGHILAYFIKTAIEPGLSSFETVQWIHQQGGLAFLAHPYRPDSGIHGSGAVAARADGYETLNGAQIFPAALLMDQNPVAMPEGTRLGGSDAHFSSWVGQVSTTLELNAISEASVYDALVSGRTVPQVNGSLFRHWYRFWQRPAAGLLARISAAPRQINDLLSRRVSRWLGVDSIELRSSWQDLFDGWFSLWRLPTGVLAFADKGVWMPLPERLSIRYGAVRLASGWKTLRGCGWKTCLRGWPQSWHLDLAWEESF